MQPNKNKTIEPESLREYKPLEAAKKFTSRITNPNPEPVQYKRIESRFSQDRISSQSVEELVPNRFRILIKAFKSELSLKRFNAFSNISLSPFGTNVPCDDFIHSM